MEGGVSQYSRQNGTRVAAHAMPVRSGEVSQVLVLRAIGLGDFLTGVPAYRGLRKAFPAATITLAAPAVLEPLVSLTGAIDRVLPVTGLGELSPLSAPPDLAVNLHGAGPQSIGDLLVTGAGRLISHRHPQYPQIAGPEWCEDMHEVARWTSLLAGAGIPADPGDLHLVRPTQAPAVPNAVIVHPGASAEARRWPVDRFGAVAGALTAAGHSVVLTGTAAERRRCFAVARCAGLGWDSVLAGDLDLANLAALVAGARLLISGDTGIAHLATAYATPSVLLFGPTSPLRWGPPAGGPFTVIWRGAAGNPHGRWVDPALLDIGSDEVLEAAEARLGDTNLSQLRPTLSE
jgi:ADP-heptose:LPS heptosyltransferase